MKHSRWLTFLLLILTTVSLSADDKDRGDYSVFRRELDERDWEALRNYLDSKQRINLHDKAHNLSLFGDVRFEWRNSQEKQDGRNLRGENAELRGIHVPKNDFDIEFNLHLDYVCNRAWAAVHLEFDNTAGVMRGKNNRCKRNTEGTSGPGDETYIVDEAGWKGSGVCDDLCLKRAYFGYNICECGNTRLDVEIGRRRLYDVFDSEVQFLSQYDGILVHFATDWCKMSYSYVNAGAFIIDERSEHYGFVGEVGFLDICNVGIDFKYSIIDWTKRGRNRCRAKPGEVVSNRGDGQNPLGFKYLISQFTLKYHFDTYAMRVPSYFYGAFLVNHDCADQLIDGTNLVGDKTERLFVGDRNLAWYFGFRFGEVFCAGDWALDIQYQYVQALAIPDRDVSGIGRGNILDDSITDGGLRGNTNYTGWRIEALYAITDNVSVDARFQASDDIDEEIGGTHRYSEVRVEAIYAF